MLYYFSGTGNSSLVCQLIAEQLGDAYSSMTDALPCAGDSVGIVFPVYAWGMPGIVTSFLEHRLPQLLHDKVEYIYIIMTCGDDMGYTDMLVRKSLKKNQLALDAAFSVQMPNTYVCLPGFDIDSAEVANSKILAMKQLVPFIATQIREHRSVVSVKRGACAFIKTYILRPLFNRFLINDSFFHVDESKCTRCHKCVKHCPIGNITTDENGNLHWKGDCTGCLGCYHICPHNAIQYGWFTKGKGQKL